MRLVIATCSVDYDGRLTAHLPLATRLLLVKADGSVLVHSDGGSYKPLNWMSPPCAMAEVEPDEAEAADGVTAVWIVQHAKSEDRLRVRIHEVQHDSAHELGVDPGLVKDGVEAHLQRLLAEHITTLGDGWTLIRREYMTPIGPVDILCKDGAGAHRRGRDQAARRHRRRRAADPLPRADEPRPAPRPGDAASSPPRRSSRRRARWPRTAASAASCSTTTRSRASTTASTASSEHPNRPGHCRAAGATEHPVGPGHSAQPSSPISSRSGSARRAPPARRPRCSSTAASCSSPTGTTTRSPRCRSARACELLDDVGARSQRAGHRAGPGRVVRRRADRHEHQGRSAVQGHARHATRTFDGEWAPGIARNRRG